MLDFLKKTCKPHKIKIDTKPLANRKYTSERAENFLRKSDGKNQAIMYYRRTRDGGEKFRIEQFTAPDGKFYSVDTVKHPTEFSE